MKEKKDYSKVMPILSIVFFGVSLISFLTKAVSSCVYRLVVQRISVFHVLFAEFGKGFAFAFPAVLFIICAAMYLKKSGAFKKWRCAALTAQVISSVILAARLMYANHFFSSAKTVKTAIPLVALYLAIAVLCLVAVFLEIKEKNTRILLCVAAALGMAVAVYMFSLNVFEFVLSYGYYGKHLFIAGNVLLSAVLYLVSLSFYYIAFLFSALFKKREAAD